MMKDSWILGFLSLLALAVMFAIVWQQRDRALRGVNDFIPFYSGARLLGTGQLYDIERLQQTSRERTGMFSTQHGYIRLPFHAAFLWPISQLPYRTAYLLWQIGAVSAFAGFIALWRPPALPATLLFSLLSIPVLHALLKGQDVPYLLLVLALTLRFHQLGNRFVAGLVFSLCAAKFHLFLLTPVLVAGQRDWRFGKGLLSGGVTLLLISFAAAGLSWPLDFYTSATNPSFSPGVREMPNLHGAVSVLPASFGLEIALSVSVAAAAWMVARRMTFPYALACSLAAGFLLSYHAYMLDAAILLPAALTVLAMSRLSVVRGVAILLLVPPTHLAVGMGFPYSAAVVWLLVGFVYLMAYEAWRHRPAAASQPLRWAEAG